MFVHTHTPMTRTPGCPGRTAVGPPRATARSHGARPAVQSDSASLRSASLRPVREHRMTYITPVRVTSGLLRRANTVRRLNAVGQDPWQCLPSASGSNSVALVDPILVYFGK